MTAGPGDLVEELVQALRCLPGVGPKSARRMTYNLLTRNRDGARTLARVLAAAADKVGHCRRCRNLTDQEVCAICASGRRNPAELCVVETPADVQAIEQTGAYSGYYFVLMGHLSPIDGVGPQDIGIEQLVSWLDEGSVREVILATNATVEGDVTAGFIADLAQERGIGSSRIAHGVPVGGELEYTDGGTLRHALAGRQRVSPKP